MGLYISKNIVEEHRGTLYATNNADSKGATFTIILPLMEQKEWEKKNDKTKYVNDKFEYYYIKQTKFLVPTYWFAIFIIHVDN